MKFVRDRRASAQDCTEGCQDQQHSSVLLDASQSGLLETKRPIKRCSITGSNGILIDDRVTQNKSPLENYLNRNGGVSCEPPQIGVIKEGYIELTTLEQQRKRSFFCCLRKKKQEPRIVDAQLVAFISHESSANRFFKLRFHSLKPGFNRKLELELDL